MVRVTLRMAKGKNIKGSPEHNRMNAWGYVKTVESIARSSLCKLLTIPPHKLLLTYEDKNYVLRTLLLPLLPRCTTAAMNAYKPMGKDWKKKDIHSQQIEMPIMPIMQERKKEKEKESYNEECSKSIFCQLFFHLLWTRILVWYLHHLAEGSPDWCLWQRKSSARLAKEFLCNETGTTLFWPGVCMYASFR